VLATAVVTISLVAIAIIFFMVRLIAQPAEKKRFLIESAATVLIITTYIIVARHINSTYEAKTNGSKAHQSVAAQTIPKQDPAKLAHAEETIEKAKELFDFFEEKLDRVRGDTRDPSE
jgi:ABC-type nickel/cobalt efflux system permease component RcnA